MKKIKWITPIIVSGTVAGTILPLLTTTSCSNIGMLTREEQIFLEEINYICSTHENLVTCHKAVTTVSSYGFDVVNYKLSNPNHYFAYDIFHQRFIVMNGDRLVAGPDSYVLPTTNTQNIFRFVSSGNFAKNSKFSQYLKYDLSFPSEIEVSTGLDVGYNTTIEKITYTGSSTSQQTVVFNTYCDILTVNAGQDMLYHYGTANNIYVRDITGYYEYGETAYLSCANSSIGFEYVDEKDHAKVDILEVKDTDSKCLIANENAEVTSSVGVWWSEITNLAYNLGPDSGLQYSVTNPKQLMKDSEDKDIRVGFLRLANDISFSGEYADLQWKINEYSEANATYAMNIILDLNGHSITDSAGTTVKDGDSRIIITGSENEGVLWNNITLTIINSKRNETEGSKAAIKFVDHPILVTGGTYRPAVLSLCGADLEYHSKNASSAAIYVGGERTAETAPNPYWAYLNLYGGVIRAFKDGNVPAVGVWIGGMGSFFQSYYGSIVGESACIAGTNGDLYNDTRIDITGGEFLTQNSAGVPNTSGICLYLPQGGITNIDGGAFIGGLPVGFKAGSVSINGGYFNALGEYKASPVEKTQGFDIDGSVVMFEASVDRVTPILSVTDGVMTSENGNILSLVSDDQAAEFLGVVTANFFGGEYLYKKTPFATHKFESKKYNLHQIGGTWTKKA